MQLFGRVLVLWLGLMGSGVAVELKLNELEVLREEDSLTFQELVVRLDSADVVIVGEYHGNVASHALQKQILTSLSVLSSKQLAVGVEWLPVTSQGAIDSYLSGKVNTFRFLQTSEYVFNWGHDFRPLSPIFNYIKKSHVSKGNAIPLLGLNAPREITRKISRHGLDSVDEKARGLFPNPLYSKSAKYEQFLREFFTRRGASEDRIERMLLIQAIWDQTMAKTSQIFLQENPSYKLLIFTGMVHAGSGQGIEDVLRRMLPEQKIVTVGSGQFDGFEERAFDYYVLLPEINSPARRSLGIEIDVTAGGLVIKKVLQDSIAKEIGLKSGDRLFQLGEHVLSNASDLRAALWLISNDEPEVLQWARTHKILDIAFEKQATVVFQE